MAVIGLSIVLASVVYIAIRPQPWLFSLFASFRGWLGITTVAATAVADAPRRAPHVDDDNGDGAREKAPPPPPLVMVDEPVVSPPSPPPPPQQDKSRQMSMDRLAMPPPPPPRLPPAPPRITTTDNDDDDDDDGPSSGASTPKAKSAPPTLAPPSFPALNSAQRARPNPLPNRSPPTMSSSSSLSPPPTHSTPPAKPSRAVVLTPGHSPLDWARIAENPNADLRNLGPGAPSTLLRVTPSLLKQMTGRKGKDAWMAIGGRVYNVTPYIDFHPGGKGELMRGAARDATTLFGEVHPWVNYEGMLRACLVGVLVSEVEVASSKMDEMD